MKFLDSRIQRGCLKKNHYSLRMQGCRFEFDISQLLTDSFFK